MRSLWPAAALALLTFCSPGNDRRAGTDTASDGAEGSAILSQMHVANTTEIQLARMAAQKASSADVRKLAEKLAVDHSKNREQVRGLARKLDVPLTPTAGGDVTTADSAAIPSDLRTTSGAEFDRAFVEHQIRDHQSNIERIQGQLLPAAQNPQIKVYLERTVADMQGHLASLKEVQQKLAS